MRRFYFILPLLLLFLGQNCQKQEDPKPRTLPDPTIRMHLIEDAVNGQEILLIGSSVCQFITAFNKPSGPGQVVEYRAVQDKLPVVLADSDGNSYDVWGEIVAGPNKGLRLEPANYMTAYWFAWGAFYPGCDLYGRPGIDAPSLPPGNNGWLIPYSRLALGALPGAIPSIDAPMYLDRVIEHMPYLDDTTLCLVLKAGKEIFVYPHPVLEWHEIVNERQAGLPFSVMYCPLTGSGNVWLREQNGQEMFFEVSGLLYNGNLIVKERNSESYWSQMRQEAVAGPQIGSKPSAVQVLEMPLSTVNKMFSRYKLLSDDTGYRYDYGNFPCGDYCTNDDNIIYSLFFDDPRLPRKERTFGVIVGGEAKVYRASDF